MWKDSLYRLSNACLKKLLKDFKLAFQKLDKTSLSLAVAKNNLKQSERGLSP